MIGRGKVKGSACKRCKAQLPQGSRRCLKCGAQVFVAQDVGPAEAARNARERLLRKYNLSEMQTNVLSAAADNSKEITVCGADSKAEGEVKSGNQRFYGDEAVAAVAALAGLGLIAPHSEDSFRLTPDGTKFLKMIHAEPVGDA
jgi:hypothetical protein